MSSTSPKLTAEQRDELFEKFRAGSKPPQLAREYGITPQSVYYILRRRGITRTAPPYLTAEQKQCLLADYRAGASMTDLAAALGKDITGIAYHLHALGVPKQRCKRVSQSSRVAIISGYEAGANMTQLAVEHDTNTTTIGRILRTGKVTAKPHSEARRKLPMNQGAFDDALNNPEAAYWIGLLMADGCVHMPDYGAVVKLSLAIEDIEHVERFRHFIGGVQHTISIIHDIKTNRQPSACVSFCSMRLAKSLMRFGVTPNKTHTAKVIGLEMNPHFWRGVIDGDGSLYFHAFRGVHYAGLSLCGSQNLTQQFVSFVRHHQPKCRITARPSKGIWATGSAGSYIFNIIRLLYEGANVSLRRKQDIADHFLTHCTPKGRLIS
jgi:Mor family transcriptional regulator